MLAKYVCLGLVSLLIVNYATAFPNFNKHSVQVVETPAELDPIENVVSENLDGVQSEEQQKPIIPALPKKISTPLNNAGREIQKGWNSVADNGEIRFLEKGLKITFNGKELINDEEDKKVPQYVLDFFKGIDE